MQREKKSGTKKQKKKRNSPLLEFPWQAACACVCHLGPPPLCKGRQWAIIDSPRSAGRTRLFPWASRSPRAMASRSPRGVAWAQISSLSLVHLRSCAGSQELVFGWGEMDAAAASRCRLQIATGNVAAVYGAPLSSSPPSPACCLPLSLSKCLL
jgi:hypothetical protein